MKMSRFVLHGGGRAYLATGGDIFIFLYKASFFLAISYLGKKIKKDDILSCKGDIGDPSTYWAADIANKHFAYSIDVSQVNSTS